MSEHRDPNANEPPIKAGYEPPAPPAPVTAASPVVQHPQGFYMSAEQWEASMIRIAAALKAPSAEESVKLEKAKARDDMHRLRAAQDEVERLNNTIAEQQRCKHVNDAKNSQWRGQVLSNGWGLVACVRCRKRYYFYPTPEMQRNGVGLGEPEARGVTETDVRNWSEASLRFALENKITLPVERRQYMPTTEFIPIPTESRPRA